MNTKGIFSVFGILFVLILVGMAVVKVWVPDAIANDSFVKLVMTFGILTLGALIISLLSKENKAKDKKEAE